MRLGKQRDRRHAVRFERVADNFQDYCTGAVGGFREALANVIDVINDFFRTPVEFEQEVFTSIILHS